MMSKTYAIADLHGRLDLLETALTRIADHADLTGTVVTLGDYVDRGPDSRRVIERLMGGLGPRRLAPDLPQGQPRRHNVAVLPSADQGWMVDG